ncbi:MAG: twin-arginine translocation signal domain-containing protein [Pseudomonadota bacterium]
MDKDSPVSNRRRALKGLAAAALLALVALFVVVLPAERNYDPTGIGQKLGLARKAPKNLDEVIDDVLAANDNLVAAKDADPMDPLPLPNPAVSQLESYAPRTETITVKLGFDEKTEIKAVLGKAKTIVYNWSVEGGKVYVDFHGHDPSKGDRYWVRYEEADGITGRSGSLVAPFAGEHGWYWLNVSETPVTIKLTVTGYQGKLVNYGLLP